MEGGITVEKYGNNIIKSKFRKLINQLKLLIYKRKNTVSNCLK